MSIVTLGGFLTPPLSASVYGGLFQQESGVADGLSGPSKPRMKIAPNKLLKTKVSLKRDVKNEGCSQ
jgi:hypothetical protein